MIARAQPLLGTLVQIGLDGLEDSAAHRAIEAGFAAIADIHRLMSFHDANSDITRLNREAAQRPMTVDAKTYTVIETALHISAASDGVFDITVAAALVTAGNLPKPDAAPTPDATATWCDIELMAPDQVYFKKPLWIDVGGIAKGFAVDWALRQMNLGPEIQCKINAGGDLRVAGPRPERVMLRVENHPTDHVPVVEIADGSLASSSVQGAPPGAHVHGVNRRAIGGQNFVSVAAEECMIADALTKVVLGLGAQSLEILKNFQATAYCHNVEDGWRILGHQA